MKTRSRSGALSCAFFVSTTISIFGQGSLTPPAAPTPTMKTLDQVEARTLIASAPFNINAAGSYYLSGNLTVATGTAITVNADNVSLDLNGFTISSTASPASGSGVSITAPRKNVVIKNGHIRGTTTFAAGAFTTGGFLDGISNAGSTSVNLRVSDVQVLGMGDDGIEMQTSAVSSYAVERCTVSVCAGLGIRAALVRDCNVDTTGSTAIDGGIVTNCNGESVGATASDFGIIASFIAENCRGLAAAGTGLSAGQASNCTGTSTSSIGLSAALAHNCQGTSTSGAQGLIAAGGTASFCRGKRDGGTAILAINAVACTVLGTGTVTATNKTLGTP